ncbi:hypothetical protein AC249_AIPGENE13394 [Exaiptasia diaphana]|nr:hypothetical protein AC249_AIPGENE13394 [Exaiptasia diaphana]
MASKALMVFAFLSMLSVIFIQDVESLTEDDYRLLRDSPPNHHFKSLPIGRKRTLRLREEARSICETARAIGC